jgi:hypothetical protein
VWVAYGPDDRKRQAAAVDVLVPPYPLLHPWMLWLLLLLLRLLLLHPLLHPLGILLQVALDFSSAAREVYESCMVLQL